MAGDVAHRGAFDAPASAESGAQAHTHAHTPRKRDVVVMTTAETPLLTPSTSTQRTSSARGKQSGADSARVDRTDRATQSRERVLHPDSPTTPLWRKFMFQFFDDILASPDGIQPSDIWELQHESTSKVVAGELRALYTQERAAATSARDDWRLARAIVRMEWRSFVTSGLLSVVHVVVQAAKPWTLFSLLSAVIADRTSSLVSAPVYAHLLALYVLHVLAHGFSSLAECQSLRIDMRVVGALQALIFETAISEPVQQRLEDKKRIADITAMYEDDTVAIAAIASLIHSGWTRPVLLAIEVYLLVLVFDSKAMLILAIMVLLLLARLAGQIFVSHLRNAWRCAAAARFNLVHECFKGILMVKLNAWEAKFRAKLAHARCVEDSPRQVFACALAVSNTLGGNSTQIFSALFFAAVANETSLFSPAQVFTSLILVDRIKHRIEASIGLAVRTLRSVAAMRKMDRYLSKTKAKAHSGAKQASSSASGSATHDHVVEIERACFTDGSDTSAKVLLANVNLRIRRGQLVLIRGDIGTGKSTLLRAMLLDAQPLYGTVTVDSNCRVAYCAQEPWLQTLSIRDNILFGAPYDGAKYQCVLDACCLLDDLDILPHGDATRVGPKGVNLSGGQKSRIALARACYADADLYILDCPLASVDAIVQSDAFRKCIVDLLRFKTVVLVSHNPEVATSEFVDQVVTVSASTRVDVVDNSNSRDSRRVRAFERRAPWKQTLHSRERSSASIHRSLNLWTCDAKAPASAPKRARAISHETDLSSIDNELVTVPKQVLPYLLRREFWAPMLLSIVATLLYGAALVAKDLWLVEWISSSPSDALSNDTYASIYSGLVALALVACAVEGVMTSLAFSHVTNRLLDAMTQALLQAPMAFFYAAQVGEILKRFFNDMDDLDGYPAMFASHLFRFAALLLFQVAVIWYLMGVVGLLVVLVVVFALATMFPATQLYRAHDPQSNDDAKRLNFIAEVMDGAASIRAFGKAQVERFCVEHGLDSDATMRRTYFMNCLNWFIIMRFTHVHGALLSVLALRLLKNEFSPMELGLTLHYLFMVEENIIGVATGHVNLACLLPSAHRVCEYCAIEPESSLQVHQTTQPPREWPSTGAIAFENVTFSYSGKSDRGAALQHLTFTVAGGEKIGVVGRTGSGKSSLAMALFRLHPLVHGRILIDGIDIARLDLRALRSRLCILPQAPMFYRCTVRHYLDPFDEFHDGDLWRVVHQCGLQASVHRLDAELWDDGENWSLGERQVLCFARALLRPSRILVLDESFSALDQANETKLLALLHDAFAESTVFLITHRLDQVLQFDKIVVLESGELREVGSAEELASDPSSAFYEFLETTLLTL